jgi:hypothetical protein
MIARYGPLVCPQFREWCGRYYPAALRALAHLGDNYQPELHVLPKDGQAIGPGALYEDRLRLLPGSYIVGFSGSSSQVAGFQVQVRLGAALLASSRIRHANISGGDGPSPQGLYNPQFVMPKAAIVTAPGEVSVQLWNLATVSNTIQLVVFVAVPKGEPA